MAKTVAFYTLGCKVNTYETEAMAELFEKRGYQVKKFSEKADVYVINTCTVTNKSDSKSRKVIRQAAKKNQSACIVACGCYCAIKGDEVSEIPGVDIILGVRNKEDIVDHVEKYFMEKERQISLAKEKKTFEKMRVTKYHKNTRAFLKIQDGCNAFCSYCIIPYSRGNLVSKPFLDIIEEAKELLKNGYKEIVLTGIHTGKYGLENKNGYRLHDVVKALLALDDLYLLRISSLEVVEITDELLELIKNDKFAKHLHIPLQNGSDDVLKAMNRRYTSEEYYKEITRIRSICSDISITCDVITGFPTETEIDHQKNYEFCKKCNFSKIHVFPYSRREGTAACKYQDLNGTIKQKRSHELLALSDELELSYNQKFLHKKVKVLVEQHDGKRSVGHTSNYLKVYIDEFIKRNTICECVIYDCQKDAVYAKLA